jgi:arylsulfatase A-like enzyme
MKLRIPRPVRTVVKCWAILVASALPLAAAKPNLVFDIADDLGYGDLGCYGRKTIRTPVLDRLAAEGIRFSRHYSGSTVCAPARSALMTGPDTGSTWLRGNGGFELRPDPEDLTVATLLKRAGYRTAMIGKSCVGGNTLNPRRELEKGFDVFAARPTTRMATTDPVGAMLERMENHRKPSPIFPNPALDR